MSNGIEAKTHDHRGAALLRVTVPGLVLAPLLAGAVFVCARAARLDIRMPLQLNYVEGFNADAAARIARGEPLYGDPSHAPFVVTEYTPAYFALVAVLIKLGSPALAAGRMLTFLCTLGTAALVVLAGRRRTGWVALAAAAFFLVDPLLPFWLVVARPDGTAVLLAISGIVLMETRDTWRGDTLAAILFAASILTKQSSIAAPIAAGLFLLGRDRARAASFAAVLTAACALPTLALQRVSHGWFLFHTLVTIHHPLSWDRVVGLAGRFWWTHPLQLAVLFVLLPVGWRLRPRSVTSLWAAVAAILGTITLGKAGSDLNYLMEALAAFALLTARELPVEWLARPVAAARLAAAVLVGATLAVTGTSLAEAARVHGPVAEAQAPYRELMRRVAAEPGIVVTDDACLLVAAGRPVHLIPFVMTQLAESGRWDQRPFLEELDRQRVRMIVAQVGPPSVFASRYTPEMRRLISLRYTVAARYRFAGEFAVLVPLESR